MIDFSSMKRLALAPIFAALVFGSTGCAMVVHGVSETIIVKTEPAGQTVIFKGERVSDGDSVTINKGFRPPKFDVGGGDDVHMVSASYKPHPWVFGNAFGFLLGVFPGVIGFGVDGVMGTWRNYDSPQVIHVPGAQAVSAKRATKTPVRSVRAETFESPIQP